MLSGGTSMFPGFPTRIENDIRREYRLEILKNVKAEVKMKFKIIVFFFLYFFIYIYIFFFSKLILHMKIRFHN